MNVHAEGQEEQVYCHHGEEKPGEFEDRYYISFSDQSTLSNEKFDTDSMSFKYLRSSKELLLSNQLLNSIEELNIYNIFGQHVFNKIDFSSDKKIRINLDASESKVYVVYLKTANGIFSKKIII